MDAALEALKRGDTSALNQMLETGNFDGTPEDPTPTLEEAQVDEDVEQEASAEVDESEVSQPEEAVEDSEAQEEVELAPPSLPDTEEITITDDKGRRPYTIDYTDRDKIRKAFSYAAGFRKMQADRDKVSKELSELKSSYSKLDELWGDGGVEGIKRVVNQLAGEGGLEGFIKAELDERQRLASMSPTEKSAWEKQQAEEAQKLEWDLKMKDLTAKEQAYQNSLKQREEEVLSHMANSAYSRFTFEGKLGNEKAESMWNKTLWNNAIEMLEEATPDGVTPSQANFNKAFEIAYSNLSSTLKMNAETAAQKTVEGKKAQASKAAAQIAKKSMAPKPTSAQQLEDTIDKGDLSAGFKAIFGATKRLF